MKINDIEQFFEDNVPKRALSELSLDSNNNIPLINSQDQSFDFDNIDTPLIQRDKIKTSDTIYFKDGKIIFVEFKRGQRIPETDFRLKAMESIIVFYNYAFNNNFTDNLCFPSDLFEIYFIYNKDNIGATALPYFSNLQRKFRTQFKHFISEYHIIESDEFIRLFNT
jgi:hypothetical protein